MVISSCLLEFVGVDRVWIMVGVSNPGLLKPCVFCRCGSPCKCDSDGRLDCFRSPVVVAVDVVRCVGGGSTVSVAVLPIVVELSGLVAELPVSVARMLCWRTLYIIFKSLPSSIISWAIHVRTFCISCWEKESGVG